MSFTNYLENKIQGHVFTGAAYTAPATKYVGLFTVAPSEIGGGTEITGIGGYVRKALTLSLTGSVVTNSALVEWAAATADWGTITHAGIFDALTGGNLLAFSALTVPKEIGEGDVLRIPASSLTITLD